MEEKITKIPTHDGNGRWARERGKERVFGHLNGVESVRAVTEESVRLGIKYLSLYTFSEENWSRPESEVGYLMNLMIKSIAGELDNFMRNGVRFLALGNREHLPELVLSAIDGAMEERISNYLLCQGAYSELVFTPVLWPDFREEDYRKALLEYSLRDRRYGKVK